MNIAVKTCSQCRVGKPLSEFSKRKRASDGLNYCCRSCARANLNMWKARRARGDDTSRVLVNTTPGVKFCPRCSQSLAVDEFPVSKAAKDGRRSYCRPCLRSYERERLAAKPEITARKTLTGRAWAAANPDRVSEYRDRRRVPNRLRRREYYQNNRVKVLAEKKRHRLENPAIYKAIDIRRRLARLRTEVNDFTSDHWLEVLEEFDHHCAYCGERSDRLEQEHMTPLSRGGAHTKSNIVPACRRCNARKHTKTAWEFLGMDWFEIVTGVPAPDLAVTS